MADRSLGRVYWELGYLDQGLSAGEAKAKASLKVIEDAALDTRAAVASSMAELAKVSASPTADPAQVKQLQAIADNARLAADQIEVLRKEQQRAVDDAHKTANVKTPQTPAQQAVATTGAIANVQRDGKAIADALAGAIDHELELRQADIRESLARGFITPAQAAVQGKAAAAAYNTALLGVTASARAGGQLAGGAGEVAFVNLTSRLKDIGAEGAQACGILDRMKGSVSTLAQVAGASAVPSGGLGLLLAQLGAVGAIGGVAVGATKLASDLDTAMRKIVAAFPPAREQINGLKADIEQLSTITPRSQKDLADAAAAIASRGVDNVAEIQKRLKQAVDIADATGTDLTSVIDGLDTIGDQFRLTTDEAATAMTRLFASSQGKVELQDVFATLEKGGSVLASLGVQAADAGEAMVALIDAGVPKRQAGTVLTTILDLTKQVANFKRGTDEQQKSAALIDATLSKSNISAKGFGGALEELAKGLSKAGVDTRQLGIDSSTLNAIQRVGEAAANDRRSAEEKVADAQKRLAAAADINRTSAEALSKILENELSAVLIKIGDKVLPTVIDGLHDFDAALKALGIGQVETVYDRLKKANDQYDALIDKLASGKAAGSGKSTDQLNAIAGNLSDSDASALSALLGDSNNIGMGGNYFAQKVNPILAGLTSVEVQAVAAAVAVRQLGTVYKAEQDAAAAANNTKPSKPTTTPPGSGGVQLTAQQLQELQQRAQALGETMRAALASTTASAADNATEALRKFREQLDQIEAKTGKSSLTSPLEALYRQLADPKTGIVAAADATDKFGASQKVAGALADATATQVDNLHVALAAFVRDLEHTPGVTRAQINELVALKEEAIRTTGAIEEVDKILAGIQATASVRDLADAGRDPSKAHTQSENDDFIAEQAHAASQLIAEKTLLETQRAQTTSTDEKAKLDAKIQQINTALATITGQVNTRLREGATITEKNLTKAQLQAQAIQNAANGALQLANAFGLVDDNLSKILQSLVQVGANILPMVKQIQALKSGAKDAQGNALATVGSVVGAALPVIGGIASVASSLFGDDPEEEARKEAQKENTRAIQQLTARVGDLGKVTSSGADIGRVKDALADPAVAALIAKHAANPADLSAGTDALSRVFGAALVKQGLTYADYAEFAKQLGITTDPTRIQFGDVTGVQDALSESELTSFADTFAGQMQKLDAEVALFPDLSDPIKQLAAFRKGLDGIKDKGGILSQTIDKFDLTTAEGVQKAEDSLQALFNSMGTLTPEQLGGLSPQEFLDALLKTQDLVKGAGNTSGVNQSFSVDRSITEVTGSRLAAMEERTAIAAEAIRAILEGGTAVIPIRPPALPTPTPGTDTVGDWVKFEGGMVINLQLPPGTTATTVTDDVLRAVNNPAFVTALSQKLQGQMTAAARARGVLPS